MQNSSGQQKISLKKLLELGEKRLSQAKIPSASLDTLILLSYVARLPKEKILAHPEKKVTYKLKRRFLEYIKKRQKRYPLAYLVKEKEFFGYSFYVDERVLIPRPETEKIVELALKFVSKEPSKRKILEVGTGSGCIAIALAKELQKRKIPYSITATDISPSALKVAKLNAKKLRAKNLRFICTDLFKGIRGKFHLILANLPYLKPEEIEGELIYEPKEALLHQDQRQRFLREARKYLFSGGRIIYETRGGKVKIIAPKKEM